MVFWGLKKILKKIFGNFWRFSEPWPLSPSCRPSAGWRQRCRRRCRARGRRSCQSGRSACRWGRSRRQQRHGRRQRRHRACRPRGRAPARSCPRTSTHGRRKQPENSQKPSVFFITFGAEASSGRSDLVSSWETKLESGEASTPAISEVPADPPSSALAKAVPRTVMT